MSFQDKLLLSLAVADTVGVRNTSDVARVLKDIASTYLTTYSNQYLGSSAC